MNKIVPTIPGNVYQEVPWMPLIPAITGNEACRSQELLSSIIGQFDVEVNPRYRPRDGKTYCNIYAWDVTSALGVEIPHWVNSQGVPVHFTDSAGIRLSCNAMYEWLNTHGSVRGWRPEALDVAFSFANRGCPVVAIRPNPLGNGHIAIVKPGADRPGELMVAQAGKTCSSALSLRDAFDGHPVEFYVHH